MNNEKFTDKGENSSEGSSNYEKVMEGVEFKDSTNYDAQEKSEEQRREEVETASADVYAVFDKAKEGLKTSETETEKENISLFSKENLDGKEENELRDLLNKEALKEADLEDMGQSADATARDGQRIEYLLSLISGGVAYGERSEERRQKEKGLKKFITGIYQKSFENNKQKRLEELHERYGLVYDVKLDEDGMPDMDKSPNAKKARMMQKNGENPTYKNSKYAKSYEKIKLLTRNEEFGGDILKALKERGFKEVPETLGDPNFTIHETESIARAAEEIFIKMHSKTNAGN